MRKILMGIVALFVVLSSACYVPAKHYTKATNPQKVDLILESVGHYNGVPRLFFVVANPTSERRNFILRCCDRFDLDSCVPDVEVVSRPRSDERVSVHALASVECALIPRHLLKY